VYFVFVLLVLGFLFVFCVFQFLVFIICYLIFDISYSLEHPQPSTAKGHGEGVGGPDKEKFATIALWQLQQPEERRAPQMEWFSHQLPN